MDASSIAAALLHSSADAIIATDRDGAITFWNPGAVRIFGFTADEATGRSLDLIIPERLRERHWQGYRQVMATGQSRYGAGELLSVPALHKSGARISVEFTIATIRSAAGEVAGLVAVMRDATARFEEMKALRQKLGAAGR